MTRRWMTRCARPRLSGDRVEEARLTARCSPPGSAACADGAGARRRLPAGPHRRPARARHAPSSSTCPARRPDAPTIVLLHALGCTAYLSWVAAIGELSRNYRVVTFDQRWHGRGIRSPRFRFADCADDVVAVLDALGIDRAVVAGYSMGGAIAQLTWRRHPDRVAGLVLCSTARNLRGTRREKLFFPLLTAAMHPLSALRAGPGRAAGRDAAGDAVGRRRRPHRRGAGRVPQHQRVVVARGAGRARPLQLRRLDRRGRRTHRRRRHREGPHDPRAPPARLAAAIAGAEVFTAPGGHASLFLDAATLGAGVPRGRRRGGRPPRHLRGDRGRLERLVRLTRAQMRRNPAEVDTKEMAPQSMSLRGPCVLRSGASAPG